MEILGTGSSDGWAIGRKEVEFKGEIERCFL